MRSVSDAHPSKTLLLSATLVLGCLALTTPAAFADCRADIAELRPKVEQVAAGRDRQLLDFDLQRAQRELAEGDEDECREAVEHARKLLRGDD